MTNYLIYPTIDAEHGFPPEVNRAIAESPEMGAVLEVEVTEKVQDVLGSEIDEEIANQLPSLIDTKIDISQKGAPLGVAPLTVDSKIPEANIPTRLGELELANEYGVESSIMRSAFRPTRTAFSGEVPNNWTSSVVVMPKADMLVAMASASKTSIYAPCIIAIPDGTPDKLGNYYLYWSTDHDNNTGGIFMAYSDHPMGPWTPLTFPVSSVHKFGTAYCDNAYVTPSGNQTETPWVIWDGVQFVMYYQQRGIGTGVQSTVSATSLNGLDWTRRGVAIEQPSIFIPGDGHSGYPTIYPIGGKFIAFSLAGGGDYSRQAISYSMGGEKFTMDKRLFVYQVDLTGDAANLRVSMALRLFEWRGEIWGQFAVKSPSSGTGVPSQYQSVISRMRDDFMGFIGGMYPAVFGASSYINHDGDLYGISLNSSTGIVAAKLEA